LREDEGMSIQKYVSVDTACGKLEGIFKGDLYTFKGVPYAAPPVGEMRWLDRSSGYEGFGDSSCGIRTAK
jgi:carboxylesterase type B